MELEWWHDIKNNNKTAEWLFSLKNNHKHDRSCYGKTSRTVMQWIVLLAGTDICHYNHMNKKEHGSIRCHHSRDVENDFSPQKINQNQWFFLQNTQWDDDTVTIHTCLGGEAFPGTICDAKVLMVGGGGRRQGACGRVHKWAILSFWEAPLKKLLWPTFM
jgi:hypothetical protein